MNSSKPVQIPIPGLRRRWGLGEAVKQATSALGVQPCPPCERRARLLDRRVTMVPWVRKK